MCSCWWGEWASCSFLACAGWVGLRVLLFCVVGAVKRGGGLLFGSLPAFSSFCVERMSGGEPAASALGVVSFY